MHKDLPQPKEEMDCSGVPVSPCQGDRELDNEVTVKGDGPLPNPRERAFLSS